MNSENLSAYIRQARLKAGYSTIRELWSKIAEKKAKQKEDWISYAYFQQIESSGRLPSIEDFLEIVNFLNLNEREACYLYARAIMPTNRTKSYFDLTLPPKPHEP